MKKNIRRIIMCGIITGLISTGMISCSKNPGDKSENKKIEAKQNDQEIIDRIVAGAKEYGQGSSGDFLGKYKDSIKIISTTDPKENPSDIRTNFELDYNDGVIIANGDFTVIEISLGENHEEKELMIGSGGSTPFNVTYTINPSVAKEDVEKNITKYWQYIDFGFVKDEGNTKVDIEDIYVKTLENGENRLTIDFGYTHKDDYVNSTGTGSFWITDGEEIKGKTVEVKKDIYEMYAPSVEEVAKLIPTNVRFYNGKIEFAMSDKEVDSIVIDEITPSVSTKLEIDDRGLHYMIFDIKARYKKDEEVKKITNRIKISTSGYDYDVELLSSSFGD